MYLEEIRLFTELVKSEICGIPLKTGDIETITPEVLSKIFQIATKHDLTHIVALALKKQKLLGDDEISNVFSRSIRIALFRYETMRFELSQIYEVFEKEKIVFVPLKGSVIRTYYPEPWMRTSGDIDILVRQEEIERAKEALINHLGYTVVNYNYHDIAMVSPSKTLLELHFKILENEEIIDRVLERVWDYVKPLEEGRYQYAMTAEYFVFHAIAHMLYHFLNGGCGARYIVDFWILENKTQYDKEKLGELIRECRLEQFVESVEKLADIWLENQEHDPITRKMELYIIEGGLFGSTESKVVARKTQTDGKVGYLFQRIFVPFKDFAAMNPKLKKYPFLYPYYTVKRWFKIFNGNVAEKAKVELKLNQNIEQDSVDELKSLFKKLRLVEK